VTLHAENGSGALTAPVPTASIFVRGLTESSGSIEAVRGVDFEVAPGEVVTPN
jgi:hypothetical protein